MKRTDPVTVGELLREFVAERGLEDGLREGRVMNAWRGVVGRDIAEYTSRLYLRDGKLYVSFCSSVARAEFFMRRARVMDELNRIAGKKVVRYIVVG